MVSSLPEKQRPPPDTRPGGDLGRAEPEWSALFLVLELVEVVQLLVLQLLVFEVLVVVQVLVLVVLVVEGEPVVVEVLILIVEPSAHFQGLQRRLPGQHCILRQSERVGTRRPTTRPPPGRPGRLSCDHWPRAPACEGGCSW